MKRPALEPTVSVARLLSFISHHVVAAAVAVAVAAAGSPAVAAEAAKSVEAPGPASPAPSPAASALTPPLVPPHSKAAPATVLVTHPRAHTLHFFDTLVRQGIWKVANLHLVGIYHASETEDYRDAEAYIKDNHIDWISLRPVGCPIQATDMYQAGACRDEFAQLVAQSSGLILNGGPDIPPALYGRETLLTTVIESPHRHIFEMSLLFHMLGGTQDRTIKPLLEGRPDYPVLGICVGMQTMNVANGGILVQDIPSEIYGMHSEEELLRADPTTLHRNIYRILNPAPGVAVGVFHPIRLTDFAPQLLRQDLKSSGGRATVLSLHHQAVAANGIGQDYVVTATSLDGRVIEGIHHRAYPHVWGWQFHPERSLLWDAKELERQREGAFEQNLATSIFAQEAASRAFNRDVWSLFAFDVVHAYAGQK